MVFTIEIIIYSLDIYVDNNSIAVNTILIK